MRSNNEWHLPTGRTVQEFLDAQAGNLKHDAEHLIGQIRQGHQRITELKAKLEELEKDKLHRGNEILKLQMKLERVRNEVNNIDAAFSHYYTAEREAYRNIRQIVR